MTTPTDKDIPSNSVQDRLYNAEKFDEFMNSDNPNYTDRKGKSRWTLNGIRQAIQNWMSSLSSPSGASSIGTEQGGTLQEIADKVNDDVLMKADLKDTTSPADYIGNFFGGEGDTSVGGESVSFFKRIFKRGQYDMFQGYTDPKGIAGVTFGGEKNKGTITVDQRGRLQVYAVKNGVLTASRISLPFTEGYGYGSGGRLGTITRFPVAGAEDDSLNSSLILLPQSDGSTKAYIAGPGLFTAYAAPESNAVKSVAKEVVTVDLLPPALIYASSNPTTWLSTSSWVKLVTVNNSQSGSVFSGIYSVGGVLSEAVEVYLIDFFTPTATITTLDTSNLKTFLRVTSLRDRGDFRYTSGNPSFGVVRDDTAGTTTLYVKLPSRSENSTLLPIRTTPNSSSGVVKVKIWNDKDSYEITEPSGIIYCDISESLTSNTTVTLNSGRMVKTRGAVVRLTNLLSAATKTSVATGGFSANDQYSTINRGYGGLNKVVVTKLSTGKYLITGAGTPGGISEWKIESPSMAYGSGLQTLVAVIEGETSTTITVGVRAIKYTADTSTGAVSVSLGDYTDIPTNSWVDVHTNLN